LYRFCLLTFLYFSLRALAETAFWPVASVSGSLGLPSAKNARVFVKAGAPSRKAQKNGWHILRLVILGDVTPLLVSQFFLFLSTISYFISISGLRQLLSQMNEHRNTGNVNAAIAQHHFARFDRLADEFARRLHRLAGEDFPGALVDMVFNEEGTLDLLDIFIQELEDNDIQDRADLDIIFKTILEGFDMRLRVVERPSTEPPSNDFIDDEADEVPEDYESEHAPEDGEMEIDPDDLDLEYLDE